jgi:hypothetical protein
VLCAACDAGLPPIYLTCLANEQTANNASIFLEMAQFILSSFWIHWEFIARCCNELQVKGQVKE